MTKRGNSMKPPRGQQDVDTDMDIPTSDYGFPVNANLAQRRCWANQERFLEAFSLLGSVRGRLRGNWNPSAYRRRLGLQ